MTTVWLIGTVAFLGSSLILAWSTLLLAHRVGQSRGAALILSRRVDELSLRVRTLENRSGSKSIPLVRRPPNHRVDPPAAVPPRPFAGTTLIAVPSLAASGSEALAQGASGDLSRRFGAIWTLADAGESVASIARTTGHPLGEVELILGLRRSAVTAGSEGWEPTVHE